MSQERIELLSEELRRTQRVAARARMHRGRWNMCLTPTDMEDGGFAGQLTMGQEEGTTWMRDRVAKLEMELRKLGVESAPSQ